MILINWRLSQIVYDLYFIYCFFIFSSKYQLLYRQLLVFIFLIFKSRSMFANSNPISQPRQQDDHQKPRNFYFSNFANSSRQDQERNNSTSNRSSISTNQNPNDMNIFRSGHRSMEHNDRQHSVQGMTNANPIMTNRFAVTGNNTQNNDDPFNFFKNAPKNIPSSM